LQLYLFFIFTHPAIILNTARMDAVPEAMRALKVIGTGKLAIRDVPLPTLRRDYVLIKIHIVALNPTDW
jgi:hypothetical protein